MYNYCMQRRKIDTGLIVGCSVFRQEEGGGDDDDDDEDEDDVADG